MSGYLETLRETAEWQQEVERVKKGRPVVPAHDPIEDNTELWKSLSAMQQGFDLCLTLFGEKPNE